MDGREAPLIRTALFWGAAWGTAEATFGHLLHALPVPGLAGSVMIPCAVYFMVRALRATGRSSSMALAAAFAALIKLAYVLLPGRGILMALRPALAILTEGLVATLAASLAARSAAFRGRRGVF